MRRLMTMLGVLCATALGVVVPATTAHASSYCDARWHGMLDGYFAAYDLTNCFGRIGLTESWDSDWGNGVGPFQGSDTNKASSILQKGTSWMSVKIYNGTGQDWGGGYSCLHRGELYASDLSNDSFSNGLSANNSISSHKWVLRDDCFDHFVR